MIKKNSKNPLLILFTVLFTFFSCSINNTDENYYENKISEKENEIRTELSKINTDADFTLLIKSESGRSFAFSRGNSTPQTIYRSASTSKLVSAVIILRLVQKGVFSLEDKANDFIPELPDTGYFREIRLKHLLNFTSGLKNAPLCIYQPYVDFEECALSIFDLNSNSDFPGETFYYSSAHLQIAGLMSVRALNVPSWNEIFQNFKRETNLFELSSFNIPSLQNPLLAGGMHWRADEYLEFLSSLYHGKILNDTLRAILFSDQTANSNIEYSPALSALGEDWHYGFGVWIECHSPVFNCDEIEKVSSPGAYGAYPFIDFKHKYFGILAREGNRGTFENGYRLFESIEPLLQQWAELANSTQ